MMQQLVETAHGLIALQWRATIKISAPNRIYVTLAGKYRIIAKKQSFFISIEIKAGSHFDINKHKHKPTYAEAVRCR